MNVKHLALLLWKNWVIKLRSPWVLATEVLVPLICAELIILLRRNVSYIETSPDNNLAFGLGVPGILDDNNSVVAFVPETAVTQHIMNLMKIDYQRSQTSIYYPALRGFRTEKDALSFGADYGSVRLLVIFDGIDEPLNSGQFPTQIRYTIRSWVGLDHLHTGNTYPFPPPHGIGCKEDVNGISALQYMIGLALIRYWASLSGRDPFGVRFDVKSRCMPYPRYREDPMVKVWQDTLPTYMVTSFLVSVMVFTKMLVAEKEQKLKESMQMMGLKMSTYQLSWLLTFATFFVPIAVLYTAFFCIVWDDDLGPVIAKIDMTLFLVFLLCYGLALVTFCLLVSTFTPKANLAAAVAGVLYFTLYVPYYRMRSQYDTTSWAGKITFGLSFNLAFSLGLHVMSLAASTPIGTGTQWETVHEPVVTEDDLSLLNCMLMLLFDSFIHYILALYIDQLLEPGAKRKPWYCLTLSYWCPKSIPQVRRSSSRRVSRAQSLFEAVDVGLTAGIEIKDLKKDFKVKGAKKRGGEGVTLDVYQDQITVLLGHNGAGKTVTLSMLTGFESPTSGTALVGGYDISSQAHMVRSSLGFCPQYNILFNRLTVLEHLWLFSKLRGFCGDERVEIIYRIAKDINLDYVLNTIAAKLSSGQKRLLSIGLALMNSKVVILDEPTSGMDPASRRMTWDILKKAREGRTILMTTHYTDEADLLADRIAIMAEGSIKCCGTAKFLKRLYGSGYHLIISTLQDCDRHVLMDFVNEHIPMAQVEVSERGDLTIGLPYGSTKQLPELLSELEINKSKLGISSLGLSTATIEEVFIKFGTPEVDDFLEDYSGSVLHHGFMTASQQSLSKTTVSISQVADSEVDPEREVEDDDLRYGNYRISRIPHIISEKSAQATFGKRKPSRFGDYIAHKLPRRCLKRVELESLPSGSSPDPVKLSPSFTEGVKKTGVRRVASVLYAIMVKKCIYIVRNMTMLFAQILLPSFVALAIILLQAIEQPLPHVEVPLTPDLKPFSKPHVVYSAGRTINQPEDKILLDHYESALKDTKHVNLERITPAKNYTYDQYVYMRIRQLGLARVIHDFVIGLEVMPMEEQDTMSVVAYFSPYPHHSLFISLNYLMNALAQFTLNSSYEIQSVISPLPKDRSDKIKFNTRRDELTATAYAMAVGVGMSFSSVMVIQFLINERTAEARHLQTVSGAGPLTYWGATFAVDLVAYLATAALLLFILLIVHEPAFVGPQGRWPIFVIALVWYGWSSLAFVYAFHFWFSHSDAGVVFSVVYNILTGVVPTEMVLIMRLMEIYGIGFSRATLLAVDGVARILFPTYCLSAVFRNIYINHYNLEKCSRLTCSGVWNPCCPDNCTLFYCLYYKENLLDSEPPGISSYVRYLVLQGLFFFIVTLLIDYKVLQTIWRRYSTNSDEQATDAPHEDKELEAERQRVMQRVPPLNLEELTLEDDPVILANISKRYGPLVAVDHVTVGIPRGECLGLVGQSGAGKTSIFKILTGERRFTSGKVYIRHYDTTQHLSLVQKQMGYCPQSEALILSMTGRETLTMYARIRGLREDVIPGIADKLSKLLLFSDQLDVPALYYSGGTRRKLVMAAALLDCSPVLLLDEPSWGMDAKAKKHLWDVLALRIRQGATIILGSHSMQECEALACRISIMVNGKLVCLGTPQQLKERFGQGYTLIIQLGALLNGKPAPTKPVIDLVQKSFPEYKLHDQELNYLHFENTQSTGHLGEVFDVLESAKQELGIQDYSVQPTTLEQIFINFTHLQSAPLRELHRPCVSCLRSIVSRE